MDTFSTLFSLNSPQYVYLNHKLLHCLAYLNLKKEDILKTQEREAGGHKALGREKRVSQKTGPDRCSAVLSTAWGIKDPL